MTTRRLLIPLMLITILAQAGIVHAQERSGSEIVKNVLMRYDDAWNKKDAEGVSRILSDDYVYFSSTGSLTSRKATLDFLASPDYKLTFVERSEIALLSQTGTVAVVSSRWKGRGTFGKEVINDDQRCGLVFVKSGKVWKLISEHCAQIVAK